MILISQTPPVLFWMEVATALVKMLRAIWMLIVSSGQGRNSYASSYAQKCTVDAIMSPDRVQL